MAASLTSSRMVLSFSAFPASLSSLAEYIHTRWVEVAGVFLAFARMRLARSCSPFCEGNMRRERVVSLAGDLDIHMRFAACS